MRELPAAVREFVDSTNAGDTWTTSVYVPAESAEHAVLQTARLVPSETGTGLRLHVALGGNELLGTDYPIVCGDYRCDPGETALECPGDCM